MFFRAFFLIRDSFYADPDPAFTKMRVGDPYQCGPDPCFAFAR
jgi:hypothetical protein